MITYEQKEVWTAALRSGNFVQGRGYLKRQSEYSSELEYCCLGVLENVCGVERRSDSYLEEDALPFKAQKTLANMNDPIKCDYIWKRYGFNDIADYIDAHFESWQSVE